MLLPVQDDAQNLARAAQVLEDFREDLLEMQANQNELRGLLREQVGDSTTMTAFQRDMLRVGGRIDTRLILLCSLVQKLTRGIRIIALLERMDDQHMAQFLEVVEQCIQNASSTHES